MPAPPHNRSSATAMLPRLVERRPAIAAALAALATLAVKHPGIATRSLWLDEAWTVAVGAHSVPAILRIAAHDQNPPLYNLLVSAWLALFGTSELALRLPSLLVSAATAALLLLFVRRFFGAEAAVTASLLYVVSPAQTVYATEGRAYALVGLLCVASFHLYLSLLAAPRRATAVALGVVNAAALYTHYTIGLAWLAQAACAPLLAKARPGRRALGPYLASQLLALALFAPFVPFVLANVPDARTSWLPPPGFAELAQVVRDLAGSRSALRAGALLLLGWGAWRVALRRRGDANVPSTGDRRIVTAVAWAVVPIVVAFAVSQRTPILLVRYELFAGIGWIVALAAVIASLPWPALARTAVALGMVLLTVKASPYAASRDPGWRELAALVRPSDGGRTMVVVAPSVDCIPFAAYAAPDLLASLFGPRGSWQPAVLHRRLAERGILCRDAGWPASVPDLDGERVVIVVSRAASDAGTQALQHAAERGYALQSSTEIAGKAIHVLGRQANAAKGAAP